MKEHAREVTLLSILAMYGFALFKNPTDTLMLGALIAAFSTAIGFYLGGSKQGADVAAKNADIVSEAARVNADQPQPVTVVNSDAQPVPTVDAK